LLAHAYNSASAAETISAACAKGVLGVGKCQVVRCVGGRCSSTVLPNGTARKARVSLGRCIGNHDACVSNCFLSVQHRPPYSSYFKDCTNRCDANHAACVDLALTLSRAVQ
jgi:hypothetical protein